MGCKLFNKKSIGLCNSFGFKFLTLVPDNFSEKSNLIKKACNEDKLEVILDKKNSRGIQLCKYEGISYDGDLFCTLPKGKSKTLKVKYLVLKSYNLSISKEKSLLREINKERKFLNQVQKNYLKRNFSCVKDLEKDFKKFLKNNKISYHKLSYEIAEKEVYVKSKKKGRPKKGFNRETVKEFIIKLLIENLEVDDFKDLGYLVLCTDNLNLSDREILLRYKEQYSVEGGIRWMKCDKQLSPIFLKTPKRINSMCMLYILSLLINNLIQWQVRKHLFENGEKRECCMYSPFYVKMQ